MSRRSRWKIASSLAVVGALFVVAAGMAWHYNARLRTAFDDLSPVDAVVIAAGVGRFADVRRDSLGDDLVAMKHAALIVDHAFGNDRGSGSGSDLNG